MSRIMKRRTLRWSLVAVGLVAVALLALTFSNFATGSNSAPTSSRLAAPNYGALFLETTTSVQDSGLMDNVIVPDFAARTGVTLTYIGVGSGKALADAAAGNCDAIIVHSPRDEQTYQRSGVISLRMPFAYNYFVIVGPKKDPAGIHKATTTSGAMRRIYAYGQAHPSKVVWVSRNDGSGTNSKEKALWKAAGITIDPASPPSWYAETGTGMAATLTYTNQKAAYTLSDTATWLKVKPTMDAIMQLFSNRRDLKNQYSIDLLNQAVNNNVNSALAEELAAWLTSSAGQKAIANYKINGQQVFFPNSYAISVQWLPPLTPPTAAAH